ncbi:UDP-N-acetylglucosamine 2-epimerase [Acinetobacter haemolyticus CIP 64.3 = MTCC 9819]|uniref:UDP-N-acetylglucosamine 2-epimerase n=1 Tax=Acinetobacter haemolyticus CIP 64.3 = MTCC 9819 TaxID=1217659 RepID=N9FG51_ACIHA|nr:UDP-N-acetylglucosamine 2-epimerase (non-hydrolyzing) [Acinetobacter haemolyticus]ENW21512.1 UDP-N-acetylglucosamine 2-epimerase [Acinetobacter haemolyticus CIP 64.3 = MTCC 9819]EPR88514.1 UDP-N-acetylglucosamine 2-epimerase [Acinetobacter haemolyticus CIP 64.3 = MTCC 9819]QXZ27488.1 UDP-N-acetylglucosamine 2-epimerase (non-hydrolyzing) [Acinetobacter haemolyticus]SPT48905.1 UDP-N-acetylglucosamine 2-epimerase [Acinetobacter haemolyticus]SUU66964.1 UDP-N-acetylglucosamine 2-epimerase [Acine
MKKRILLIFGTRPEAIKMAPLALKLQAYDQDFETKVCVTGQHRQMLDQVLELFSLKPDFDLNLMKPGQTLSDVTSGVLKGLEQVFAEWMPDLILVHGDTATTFAASLAGYYHKIKIGHVEAGLRTGDLYSPWPEEANRQLTGVLANYHFAPTQSSYQNLMNENVDPATVVITGNTVIDALLQVKTKVEQEQQLIKTFEQEFSFLDKSKKLILVTGHRRENFGQGFLNICTALANLAKKYPDIQIVYPVHLNPNVQQPVNELLANIDNVFLIAPQDYLPFVYLMNRSYLILTDSGGIQEEAPSLGKPVLVMRDTTERPEAVEAGTVRLVGTDVNTIENAVIDLLENLTTYKTMSEAHNPYGDGTASQTIVDFMISKLI